MAHVIQMAAPRLSAPRGPALHRASLHGPQLASKPPLPFPAPPGKKQSLLALWHLLSLDAPTVAALWTWFIARTAGLALPFSSVAAMFVAVWLLYAGDRLLDARRANDGGLAQPELEPRHYFHEHHRRAFLPAIAGATLLLAVLLPRLPFASIYLYLVEGSFLTGYFLLIHASRASYRLPKEFAVGLFFAAATFIPTISQLPQLRLPLLLPAMLFAALCTLNCLFIYAWEHPADAAPSSTPAGHAGAHPATLLALRSLPTLCAASIVLALVSLHLMALRFWTLPAAVALSTATLLLLHYTRRSFEPTMLRATADLALLTPLLFLLFR